MHTSMEQLTLARLVCARSKHSRASPLLQQNRSRPLKRSQPEDEDEEEDFATLLQRHKAGKEEQQRKERERREREQELRERRALERRERKERQREMRKRQPAEPPSYGIRF